MTLKEMLETTHNIGQIEIDVRDAKGFLIDKIHIGSHVDEDRYQNEHTQARWKCIKKPINLKETGSDYWGIILKNIPAVLLNSKVTSWRLGGCSAFYMNNNLWAFETLHVNLLGVDKYIEAEATETDQLEGQMSIEDFLGREK